VGHRSWTRLGHNNEEYACLACWKGSPGTLASVV